MSVPAPVAPVDAPYDGRDAVGRVSWVFLALGLVLMVLGMMAIGAPHVATAQFIVVLGILLVASGITEVIHAVMTRHLRGFAMHLVAAALYLIVGLFVLEAPARAAGTLTLLLAAAFFAGGILRLVFAVVDRFPAWPWVALNGAFDLVLGALIWSEWPESSFWVIGLFVGLELLLHGWSWVVLGLTARSVSTALPPA